MVRWFSLLVFLLSVRPVSAQVLLNEIYYDHPGKDDGFEFVELINVSLSPVSLNGYAIEFHDGASTGWQTVWRAEVGDSVGPEGLFVVGGSLVRPPPQRVVDLALQNGPDALRLVRGGVGVDRVGYGAIDDPEFMEGESADDAPEGRSLSRVPDGRDTDWNAVDFRIAGPTPGAYNVARRDVGVALDEGTPQARALLQGGDDVRLWLVNRGTLVVPEAAVAVDLEDSSAGGSVAGERQTNDRAIAPGDSIALDFTLRLGFGYHWIRFLGRYDRDERGNDNQLTLVRRVGEIPIVVSEIMSDPVAPCPEFVEIHNAGSIAIDITMYAMRDGTHDPSRIEEPARPMPAGAYWVLTADAAALAARFPGIPRESVLSLQGSWPSLNHTGSGGVADSVVITDAFGLPVDAVGYPPQPSDARGRSLERVDLYPGRRSHTWVVSVSRAGGTPGLPNTSELHAPPHGGVEVFPNPFDPFGGETMIVTLSPSDHPSRAVARVFDTRGVEVRALGTAAAFPFLLRWDGRDNRGRLVPAGIYLLGCEFFSEQGARRVERVVLGCARKPH